MQDLLDFLSDILVWFKDLLLWVPRKLTELVLDGLALLVESIPVPTWLQNQTNLLGNISPEIAFFAEAFALSEGFAIVFGATLIRFLIRRIPFIG